MTQPDKPPLEKEARRLFLRASREVPTDIEARLHQARLLATSKSGTGKGLRGLQRRLWWPAGALAVSCAVLLLWQPGAYNVSKGPPAALPAGTAQVSFSQDNDGDLPPDAGQNDVGMYQDLAFYNWLASSQSPSSAP